MDLHSNIKDRVNFETWEYIAQIAHSFELDLEQGDPEIIKLQKELQMIKRIIHAHLSNGTSITKFLSAKFLIKLYRTIEKLDEKIALHKQQHKEFLIFLRALLGKMKREKLVVYKTLEKKTEFQRHKEVGDSV
ncbi:MAG: hypothetical protein AB1391_02180 [Candidatus Micrarchaeota archaeon]